MKFRLLCLILILSQVFFSQAQKNPDSMYNFSIHAGFNMSRNLNIDSFETDQAIVPFVGLNVYRNFGEKFKGGMGIYYSVKGSNIVSNNQTYRFQYAGFQFSGRYCLTSFLDIYAGLEPSLLLKAVYKKSESKSNISGSFNKFAFNVPVGVEINLQKHVSLGLSYDIPNKFNDFGNFKLGLNIFLNPDKMLNSGNARKEKAVSEIRNMKAGVLLVRLNTDKSKQDYLLKTGKKEEADLVKNMADQRNKEIIRAFRQKFNFCPVYFFEDFNIMKIYRHDFKNIFLNDSLVIDTGIMKPAGSFYLAEFSANAGDNRYMEIPDTSVDNESRQNEYYSSSRLNIFGLRILNPEFRQPEAPFPSFVRMNEGLSTRHYDEVIDILNKRLFQFYKKSMEPPKTW